jgi:YVTN family beta-propeller protein
VATSAATLPAAPATEPQATPVSGTGAVTAPSNATSAPATPAGTVTSIPVGAGPFGIVAGAGSIWVPNLGDGTLMRIDPTTNRVVATIAIGATPVDPNTMIVPSMAVAATDTAIWVTRTAADQASGAAYELLRLDPATNAIVATIPLAYQPDFLAATVDSLWIVARTANLVLRVDIATSQIATTIALDAPIWVTVGEGAIWVSNGATPNPSVGNMQHWIAKIDPATNTIVGTVVIDQFTRFFAVDAGSLWVPGLSQNEVLRIDTATLEVTGRIHVILPGTLVASHGALWVQSGRIRTLSQIDPATATVVGSYSSAGPGGPIAALDDALWIGEIDTGTLVRVDP